VDGLHIAAKAMLGDSPPRTLPAKESHKKPIPPGDYGIMTVDVRITLARRQLGRESPHVGSLSEAISQSHGIFTNDASIQELEDEPLKRAHHCHCPRTQIHLRNIADVGAPPLKLIDQGAEALAQTITTIACPFACHHQNSQ
jgi:hypothetical protein